MFYNMIALLLGIIPALVALKFKAEFFGLMGIRYTGINDTVFGEGYPLGWLLQPFSVHFPVDSG
jgi:hypothetical protein